MNEADLIAKHPQLFHMASEGSWETIEKHGLLTTRDLVESSSLNSSERHALLRVRRATSSTIAHPVVGEVTIRDQGPLREQFLDVALTDMSPGEWLDVLNGRVFFWLHPDKLSQLLGARRYRNSAHDVITVDSASLLAAHLERVRLSPINSGATLYPNAPLRGSDTFQSIEDYDYEAFRKKRGPRDAIVELAVLDGVADIREHVIRVDRRQKDDVLTTLYKR